MNAATAKPGAADFAELALQVRAAGLLDRRRAFYARTVGLTVAALAGGWTAFIVVGNSWAVLGVAVFLGLVFAHLGFIGHDAGHQQIFSTRRANRLLGLVLGNVLVGLSYGWWVPKHNLHHAHPNELERDPDVGSDNFAIFGDGDASGRTGAVRLLARWRAPLFFPLMLLRSLGLHVGGARRILGRPDREALGEGLLVLVHVAAYLTIVLWVVSPLKALAFIVVQHAVFSVYLGLSFAPNHKGMPLIPAGSRLDFAHRQVLTSRTLSGGAALTFLLGGLDMQIEHHLFPSMPRPNLRRAQVLVKGFCESSGLPYCEVSFLESLRMIVRHLRTRPVPRTPVDQELARVTGMTG